MLKDLALDKSSKRRRFQKKAEVIDSASSDEEDSEKNAEDPNPETNFDPVRSTVYVYAGREVKPQGTEIAAYILQSGLGVEKVGYLNSASDADVRSALWDEDCKVSIFNESFENDEITRCPIVSYVKARSLWGVHLLSYRSP